MLDMTAAMSYLCACKVHCCVQPISTSWVYILNLNHFLEGGQGGASIQMIASNQHAIIDDVQYVSIMQSGCASS